jgi:hypothetical protein
MGRKRVRPCIPNFYQTFESVFESEIVFRDFRSLSLTLFFRSFWNRTISKISEISEISEHSENPVYELSKLFLNFSQIFWPKNKVFWLKNQTLHTFFEIYIHFRIISKLFSELKFPNFFRTFSRKFRELKKSVFFQKNSELRQPNISVTHEMKSSENSI